MKVVNDQRADSTLDAVQPVEAGSILGAIAAEELQENEALAQAIEAQAEAEAERVMSARIEDWQAACRHGADIVTSAVPDLKDVWAPDRMDRLGAALARADAHYGWGGAGRFLGHPLVAVGVAALPVAIGTATWAKAEREKRAAQRIAASRGEPVAMPAMAPAAAGADVAKPAPGLTDRHPNAGQRITNIGPSMDAMLRADSVAA